MAKAGNHWHVIVDDKELKPFQSIGTGTLSFSPDGKHVAYAAFSGDKMTLVINEHEGPMYDVILTRRGGKIIFDSPKTFHYLVSKENTIYLVEEKIQ